MYHNFDSTTWNNFLKKKALEVGLTRSEARVFFTRFNYDNWLERIEDIWHLSDVNSFESFTRHSTNIYRKFRSECPNISNGAGNFTILRDYLLEIANSGYYPGESDSTIKFTDENECYQAILQPGALIRIKAPSKMGKTSLLDKIIKYADEQEYRTIRINLLQIERDKFSDLDKFLRWFCIYINDSLNLDLHLDDYWNKDRGSMLSCTRYLEKVLQDLQQPLVLGLDEVDRLLSYPDISQDFFYLLRSWHEEANNEELLELLRLVVVYSTEDFGSLDINQSPFNVGVPIELKSFNQQQVEQLAISYQLNLSKLEINQVMTMLGGHPYLVDLTMSYLANNSQESLMELLDQAATDTGIYSSYLRQHLINIQSNNNLHQIFLAILNSSNPIQVDTLLAHQLYRMGLIKWSKDGNTVMPSCELYKLYFLPRLDNI